MSRNEQIVNKLAQRKKAFMLLGGVIVVALLWL